MSMGTLTLAASLLLTAAPTPGDVVPINQRNFQIPIRVEPSRRHEIKELILFASTDQGATWNQVATATPDKEAFVYYAPSDGLYWFSVCVVDSRGNREPPDIYKAPPGQKVHIDTAKPAVRITAAERQGEDVTVAWDIQDDRLDLSSLRLEYRSADAPAWSWTNAAVVQTPVGQTRFRVTTPGAVAVRLQVQDLAGNTGSASADVAAGPTAPTATTTAFSGTAASAGSGGFTLPGNAPALSPPPPTPVSATPPPWGGTGPVQTTTLNTAEARTVDRGWPTGPNLAPAPGAVPADAGGRLVASSNASPSLPVPSGLPGGAQPPRPTMATLQVTNNPQIQLDYQVDKVGPSGVGSVELWVTQDDGRTWRKLAEDSDLKPPITVELPGEGIYGLQLVVRSRANLGRRPPQSGDLPQMRIEVDTTPPVAQLYAPEPDTQHPNALVLTWSVTDRTMAANPITLQWAERPDGAWQQIGAELPNTGRHSWQLPASMPGHVYLRLMAKDAAGNTCVAQTPSAVVVDLSQPEGQLIGIVGTTRRP